MGKPLSLRYLSSFAVSLLIVSASSVMVEPGNACPPVGDTLLLSVVLPPAEDLPLCLSLTGS